MGTSRHHVIIQIQGRTSTYFTNLIRLTQMLTIFTLIYVSLQLLTYQTCILQSCSISLFSSIYLFFFLPQHHLGYFFYVTVGIDMRVWYTKLLSLSNPLSIQQLFSDKQLQFVCGSAPVGDTISNPVHTHKLKEHAYGVRKKGGNI